MNLFKYFFIAFFYTTFSNAQIEDKKWAPTDVETEENDTILNNPILLEEVLISNVKLDTESLKQFTLLQRRVYKVWPYARLGALKLVELNKNMDKLKTNKEKKKYYKIVEDYLDKEFKGQLKKLSRQQGQIFVKLIYRQTGVTTYDLIKDYKSGWKAYWSNNTAKLFDLNLKAKYEPYEDNQDYLIETILVRAFNNGRLAKQPAANPVDFEKLADSWEQKAIEQKTTGN